LAIPDRDFRLSGISSSIAGLPFGEHPFEKHGAEFLRLSRFHTGTWAGEWLISTRYASWEVYGKAQEAIAKDPAFAKLYAQTATFAELMGRNIAVGVDL
jgi:hypothetical protein